MGPSIQTVDSPTTFLFVLRMWHCSSLRQTYLCNSFLAPTNNKGRVHSLKSQGTMGGRPRGEKWWCLDSVGFEGEVSHMTRQSTACRSLEVWTLPSHRPAIDSKSAGECGMDGIVFVAPGSPQIQPRCPIITTAMKQSYMGLLLPLLQVCHRHYFKCSEKLRRRCC